jgi:hypothetical protein
MMTHNNSKRIMLIIKSKTTITFLSITSILFIFLFSIIDNNNNNIIITVQSSIENTTQTTKNNSSNQSDPTSNFTTAVQWKKLLMNIPDFGNETIGISLEYPSNWEVVKESEYHYRIVPKYKEFQMGEYPNGTYFEISRGLPDLVKLEVKTRMDAANVLDSYSKNNHEFQIIGRPNMNEYTIDGEKAGTFSYSVKIDDNSESSLLPKSYSSSYLEVEKIIVIHDGLFFNLEFSLPLQSFLYSRGEFNYEDITTYNYRDIIEIKDHMFNSIRWLN